MNLPLTRRNLVAFTRWREEQDPGRRQSWERVCGLHPDEVRALEALDANLLACGPATSWWVENAGYRDGIGGLHLRSGLAEHLCHGLAVDEHTLPELVKVCGVHDGWPARGLENGLRAHLGLVEPVREKVKAGASFSAECMRIGGADEATPKWSRDAIAGRQRKETSMVAESNGHAAVGAKMAGVREELKKLDLSQPVPNSVKRDLAKQFDCSDATVSAQVSVLRRELGIAAPDRSSWSREREKPEMEPSPPVLEKPQDPLAVLADAAPVPEGAGLSLDLASYLRQIEALRRERDETAKALAEVQDERDRLKGARGPDPALATLRAQVEQLKADSAAWEQRASEARAQRDAAIRERDAGRRDARQMAFPLRQLAIKLAAGYDVELGSGTGLHERQAVCELAAEILELCAL